MLLGIAMTVRNKTLRVRYSDAELNAIQALSDEAGLSRSDMVRSLTSRATIKNKGHEKRMARLIPTHIKDINTFTQEVEKFHSEGDALVIIAYCEEVLLSLREIKA